MKEGARVMSLTDGTSKMSKSDPVEGSRINLTDSPDVIAKKVSGPHSASTLRDNWCQHVLFMLRIPTNACLGLDSSFGERSVVFFVAACCSYRGMAFTATPVL